MKSDEQLLSEVEAEIHAAITIEEADRIGVAVHHGVVTLTGTVGSETCKREAERATWRVAGVRAVAQEIEIRSEEAEPKDAEIAEALAVLLEWNADVESKDVHARVEHGWVTLDGSVPAPAQLSIVSRLASQVRGVKGVSSQLRLVEPEPRATVSDALQPGRVGWTPIDEEC